MIVYITQDCINHGIRCAESSCPIAIALAELVECLVMVSAEYVVFKVSTTHSIDVNLPIEAQQFIRDFDDDEKVCPFDFPLDIPEEALK